MTVLSEIQLDLLKEALNVGVGQAAFALSELAGGEEILLNVPEIKIQSCDELINEVRDHSGDNICGVSEKFTGPVPGRAIMIYSQEESLELVRLMLQETMPVEFLSEMEGEALCEVGNIVLNACISSLANLLGVEIQTEVPRLHIGTCSDVMESSFGALTEHVVRLQMSFTFTKHKLHGQIGFYMDLPSVSSLAQKLDERFQKMLGS